MVVQRDRNLNHALQRSFLRRGSRSPDVFPHFMGLKELARVEKSNALLKCCVIAVLIAHECSLPPEAEIRSTTDESTLIIPKTIFIPKVFLKLRIFFPVLLRKLLISSKVRLE